MEVGSTVEDTFRATRMMCAAGVRAIVVLGGDGTHRAVARECGEVPIAGVSTGHQQRLSRDARAHHHRAGRGAVRRGPAAGRAGVGAEQGARHLDQRWAAPRPGAGGRRGLDRALHRRPRALENRKPARPVRHLRRPRGHRHVGDRRAAPPGGPARAGRPRGGPLRGPGAAAADVVGAHRARPGAASRDQRLARDAGRPAVSGRRGRRGGGPRRRAGTGVRAGRRRDRHPARGRVSHGGCSRCMRIAAAGGHFQLLD